MKAAGERLSEMDMDFVKNRPVSRATIRRAARRIARQALADHAKTLVKISQREAAEESIGGTD